jgi:hypothetical protein
MLDVGRCQRKRRVGVGPSLPASHKLGGVRAARDRRSRGGAGAGTSSTRPVLARLISRLPFPFNGELLLPAGPALNLAPLATNTALKLCAYCPQVENGRGFAVSGSNRSSWATWACVA